MGQLLQFPTPQPKDGGKSRIQRRRRILFQQEPVDELVMLHADVADTRPSELA
jgi:hypothetical protein